MNYKVRYSEYNNVTILLAENILMNGSYFAFPYRETDLITTNEQKYISDFYYLDNNYYGAFGLTASARSNINRTDYSKTTGALDYWHLSTNNDYDTVPVIGPSGDYRKIYRTYTYVGIVPCIVINKNLNLNE